MHGSVLDGGGSRVAIDAFANQLAHEPHIPQGLALLLDVELREEAVVDVAVAFAALQRIADLLVVVTLALEFCPERSLGETALR